MSDWVLNLNWYWSSLYDLRLLIVFKDLWSLFQRYVTGWFWLFFLRGWKFLPYSIVLFTTGFVVLINVINVFGLCSQEYLDRKPMRPTYERTWNACSFVSSIFPNLHLCICILKVVSKWHLHKENTASAIR
jgi:hypothetical protein